MTKAAVNLPLQLLVIGGGYTGQRFARAWRQLGNGALLTSRQAKAPSVPGRWLVFDPEIGAIPTLEELAGTTHVLVSLPPRANGEDPALVHLGELLRRLPLAWLGYLSTTGVYGDSGGAWVDESTPVAAAQGRSRARQQAEESWLESGLPVQIFRLPAIYGPHRSPFKALLAGESRLIHKPQQVFSRVHVDDIVGSLLHCQKQTASERPKLINVCDDYPCPSSETLGFAAHLLNCPLPRAERFGEIAPSLSAMARSFWAENRRASNRLLCQGLGYKLRYPSYRQGYLACLAEERGADWFGKGELGAAQSEKPSRSVT
ncbi:SDR family oxidoreductase [Cyanobium sp. HWJ4-Hawea]|uniref:SDR family oxidoreductase n=1 Tax=Cyanobium sp. HWJ4-Hawea TaxID=2823713 RepID=UPI0020CCC2A1|nr:SDR family oxidoreductase [Cyanobium sp. HWJ4-Hawea]MCP9808090.1 SDR family oxidoreductase [Cyanobium sp. HWJ4-Hawea]